MTASAVAERDDDLRNTAVLSGIGILNRALTVLTQVVLASQLGRSVLADVYFAVEIFPDLFIVLLGSGLSLAAIPVYSRLRRVPNAEHDDEHWRFASSFILVVGSIFAGAAVLLMAAAPWLVSMLAPGFTGETRALTISLLRIVLASLAFLGPEAGLRALFHSHRHFAGPDLARFAYNLVLLGAIVVFEPRIGIHAIGWGMVVGAFVMIAIQFGWAKHLGLLGKRWHRYHPAVPDLLRKAPLVLVILAWPMVLLLLDRASASRLDRGTVAALGYAARIVMLPIGIIALPLASAMYPRLSELGGQASMSAKLGRELTDGLRMLLFLVLPACGVLFVARGIVVEALFERGQFGRRATRETTRLLQMYVLSVPGLSITFFLRNAYLALDRAAGLCAISLATWAAAVLVNMVAAPIWGAMGIAAATALISVAAAAAMVCDLRVRCRLDLSPRRLTQPLVVLPLLAATMAGVVDRSYAVAMGVLDYSALLPRLLVLVSLCALGTAAYLSAARLLAIKEAVWFVQLLRRLSSGGRVT